MRICWGSNKINADWESLFQSYRRFVKPSHVVLEIGASVVERTREISRHCGRVIGVELMPERKPADFGTIHADLQRLLAASAFKRYEILPLVFGLHGGPIFCYWKEVPHCLRSMANYWEIHLFKD